MKDPRYNALKDEPLTGTVWVAFFFRRRTYRRGYAWVWCMLIVVVLTMLTVGLALGSPNDPLSVPSPMNATADPILSLIHI